ncbi:MAG: phosphate-starvation-inducible E-like protein [Deltaproteobacteria bacterium HGW-Deltaproteobacteria-12]|jgi:uncharacterized membrane protein (DUF373 family)|nr:MAG: phosphate-starvation-inducible E-like protein [Deltaproteobacteria bacterium HGW-Deltaproteobacteria-12]
MKKAGKIIQKVIIYSLIVMMTALLILATIELGYYIFKYVIESKYAVIDLGQLMELFGIFMLVLIGIELLDTIKVYLKENVMHVEVVVLVAIIAVARKVVVLKIEEIDGLKIIGVAFIIVALAVAYYLIKKSGLMVCSFDENEKNNIVEQEK